MSQATRPAWLLLVHQLPPRPTNARVKTWRRLQSLGAIALKNSVYVLPNADACREDFEWMKSEIHTLRGEATVFAADSIDTFSNDEVVAAFRRAREGDYAALERDAQALLAATAKRSPRAAARRSARRARQLRERLREVDAIAFFPPPSRETAAAAVARLDPIAEGGAEPAAASAGNRLDPARFQKRLWITRPRPGVDRMSSAWLIRRFVDPKARFGFSDTPPAAGGGVPFDMYAVEFSHTDRGCTFETLLARFGLGSPPLDRLAHIVHDLDLKETRYDEPEGPAIAQLVDGLRLLYAEDDELLERGMAMFEALYRSFSSTPSGASRRTVPPRGRKRRRARRGK